jgi:tRNA G26 N,N-dimethylase Trm1
MIEIFKTNVQKKSETNHIIAIIKKQFPDYVINFDLEDCDRILRVEAAKLEPGDIINYLNCLGYICIKLE